MKRKEIENRKRKRKKTLPPSAGPILTRPARSRAPPSPPTAHTAQPRTPRHPPDSSAPLVSDSLPLASLSL
jgi:hypothetical protein